MDDGDENRLNDPLQTYVITPETQPQRVQVGGGGGHAR